MQEGTMMITDSTRGFKYMSEEKDVRPNQMRYSAMMDKDCKNLGRTAVILRGVD